MILCIAYFSHTHNKTWSSLSSSGMTSQRLVPQTFLRSSWIALSLSRSAPLSLFLQYTTWQIDVWTESYTVFLTSSSIWTLDTRFLFRNGHTKLKTICWKIEADMIKLNELSMPPCLWDCSLLTNNVVWPEMSCGQDAFSLFDTGLNLSNLQHAW